MDSPFDQEDQTVEVSTPDSDQRGDKDSSDPIIGIDLGTTNSAIAVMQGSEPEILPNRRGNKTTPSVVSKIDGEINVGQTAKNRAVTQASRTVQSIKRSMGENVTVELEGQEYTPEQISSLILDKLKADAEDYLGQPVDKAIITVPAYFSDRQRKATQDAGEITGFEVLRILNEPTAAAMAYGIDREDTTSTENILVFDLGGGTYDVSILELSDEIFEVQSTNGDTSLGGDDWDAQIVDYLMNQFEEETGIDLRGERQATQRLSDAAENAKIDLSTQLQTRITIPFIAGNNDLECTLTRDEFENITEHLVQRIDKPLENALQDAGLNHTDIDDVILVGGSTRIPAVRQRVREITGKEPRKDVNPEEAVAVGAGIQAGILSGEVDDIVLVDVIPLSVGVEVKGGLFERVVERNTTIPTRSTKQFTTSEDNQETVVINVWQGERERVEQNVKLGEFELTNIPPQPAGVPEIEVSFKIDSNGRMNISATETGTGQTEQIQIEGGVGLSEDEINQLREEAEQHKHHDEEFRRFINAKRQLKEEVQHAQRLLDQGHITADKQRNGVKNLIDEANNILAHDYNEVNLSSIEKATTRFQELLSKVEYQEQNERPAF